MKQPRGIGTILNRCSAHIDLAAPEAEVVRNAFARYSWPTLATLMDGVPVLYASPEIGSAVVVEMLNSTITSVVAGVNNGVEVKFGASVFGVREACEWLKREQAGRKPTMIENHPEIDAYGLERRLGGDVLGWSIDTDDKWVTFLVPANQPVGPFPPAIAGYTVQLVPIKRPATPKPGALDG